MKSLLASMLVIIGLTGSVAMAFPNAAEMAQNFDVCAQSDANWMNRFGNYLVSFDLGSASDMCRASSEGPAQVMACRADGQWIYAGYYCSVAPY